MGLLRKKRLACAALLVSLWCMLLFLAPSIVYLNMTASLPLGLYVRVPATVIRKGDIVCYYPPEEVVQEVRRLGGDEHANMLFMKEVGAMPGERYCVDGETGEFVAAEKRIGVARKFSTSGVPMPDHSGTHIVPEGEFLPVAPNMFSFDGRYTGTCPLSAVVSRAVPLIIFP